MARLIEAEKLASELYKHHVHDDEELEPLVYLADAEKVIADAPTVDAIPVDWLRACVVFARMLDDWKGATFVENIIHLYHEYGFDFFKKKSKGEAQDG